jgi:hypothetical protein
MSDEEPQAQESEEPSASGGTDSVDAAMAGIPGLADSMAANRAADAGPVDETGESEEEEPDPSVGTPRAPAEDSETVKQALKQFGLQ